MTTRLTKFIHTSHITFAVGWLGAVVVFLVLAITGITSQNTQLTRSAYLSMEVSGWFVLVPFCLAALLTGVIESITTKWGFFKHYWILVKLILTIAATIILLLHMKPISYIANVATEATFPATVLPNVRLKLIADAGAALLLLLFITTISVYKPWGRIPAGVLTNRKRLLNERNAETAANLSWKVYALIAGLTLLLIVIILHISGGGMMGRH